ncbi:MAG TPA: D-2-hydroxyacid dehydrogenase [Chloroflexi bacterium]|nr:D-2-hydroxyacid dehydrogenase [Chloroflexota bacterium]
MTSRVTAAVYTDTVTTLSILPDRFPQVDFTITDQAETFAAAARDAEILYIGRKYDRALLASARRLKWLHLGGTGINPLLPLSDFAPETILTHSPGLNAAMIADHILCAIAMLVWDFPHILRNQMQRRWERWGVERLEGKTLLLVGLGSIGRAVAHRAGAAGMRVVGVKRVPGPLAGVERVVGPDQLHGVLPEADFVVLAVPLTPETNKLIAAAALQRMKATAYLVNVSRGAVVDEAALVAALHAGQIAGAALDVFEQEPLPPESELWGFENVIITPHIASWSSDYRARALELFCQNLECYLAGRPMAHLIDRQRAY